MGNKDRFTCGATLIAVFTATFCRCYYIRCPITGANRRKILSYRCSLRPQRSICCFAYHPTSTNGGSLWMRRQRYLRVLGLQYLMGLLNNIFVRLSRSVLRRERTMPGKRLFAMITAVKFRKIFQESIDKAGGGWLLYLGS